MKNGVFELEEVREWNIFVDEPHAGRGDVAAARPNLRSSSHSDTSRSDCGSSRTRAFSPSPSGFDEARVFENLEVLRHRGFETPRPPRGPADAGRAGHEPLDDGAPHGMREREEAAIEFRLIVHLMVNYIT
jgi:hypothetical protein